MAASADSGSSAAEASPGSVGAMPESEPSAACASCSNSLRVGFLANGMNPEYGHMAAAGLLLSLPTVLIAIVFHRALLSGLHAFAGGK
jgi:hypothetical protein